MILKEEKEGKSSFLPKAAAEDAAVGWRANLHTIDLSFHGPRVIVKFQLPQLHLVPR